MKVTVEYEEGDFDQLHDTLFDLSGHSFGHKQLELLWMGVPESIKANAIHWGMNDTEVGGETYKHFEEKFKKQNLTKWED